MTYKKILTSMLVCILVFSVFTVFAFSNRAKGGINVHPSWPCFGHDHKNTGLSEVNTSNVRGIVNWSFSADSHIITSPVIGPDGTIFVGSKKGKLYAVNSDGSKKWSYKDDGYPKKYKITACVGDDGTIYFSTDPYNTSEAGKLYALNEDGSLKWSFNADDEIAAPKINKDTIYFGSRDGYLYALNTDDGSLRWKYRTDGDIISSPAITDEGTILIGNQNGSFLAIDSNGALRWNYTARESINTAPTIGNDLIYFGDMAGYVYALHKNGTLSWEDKVSSFIKRSISIGTEGTLYVPGSGNLIAIYETGLNEPGDLKWKYKGSITDSLTMSITTSPAIGKEGTIYIGIGGKVVHAINPDGSRKWNYTANLDYGYARSSSPAIGPDGSVYIGCTDGKLYAFGPCHEISLDVEGKGKVSPEEGKYTYSYGEEVTVQASNKSENWTFSHWSGDYPVDNSEDKEISIVLNQDKSLVAHFEKVESVKDSNGENTEGIPGFTLIILFFSLTLVTIYKYKKR